MSNKWRVELYEDARGRQVVAEIIRKLQARYKAEVARSLDLLAEFGHDLGMPHVRPLGHGLRELRCGKHARLIFVPHTGRRFIILHGFWKTVLKTPRREIETALRRWADWKEREAKGKD